MKGIFSLTVSSLVFGVFASALTGAPPPTDEPIIVLDRLIVQVSPVAGIKPPPTVINTPNFGHAELDAICRVEGVSNIRPLFPGADPDYTVDLSRYYVVTFAEAKVDKNALGDTKRAFELSTNVESVEYDALHFITFVPNDTYYGIQWGLRGGWGVNAESAWDDSTGSSNVVVAIADTGVDYDHPDINDDIWVNTGDNNNNGIDDDGNGYIDDWCGWDFVEDAPSYGYTVWPGEDGSEADNDPMDFNGHGTHCSGIAAAETDNNTGIAALGFDACIMCLRVGWSYDYSGTERGMVGMSYCAEAMYYAANMGAVAYNASWNSSNNGGIAAAISYATSWGVQICKSAGNTGEHIPNSDYLANHTDVMCVAATDSSGRKASFSSYGTQVDVSAPGSNIYSTIRIHYGSHTYTSESGTSMAAPFVTGLVGLCKSYNNTATRSEIRNAIEDSCRPLNNDSYYNNGYMGEGLINADGALDDVISENHPPGPFNLLAPADTVFIDLPYTFDWEDSVDPDGDDVIYTLQYFDNPGFIGPYHIGGLTASEYTFNAGYFNSGNTYWWRVQAIDDGVAVPLCTWSNQTWSFTITPLLDIPEAFSLSPPAPNPSSGKATISYAIPAASRVVLDIYNLRGQIITTIDRGEQPPGYYDITVTGLSSGIYLYRLIAGGFSATKKMVVIR